ncbi:stealth family protein [Desulfovibrio litoralis]|uniref:Stealth protein CR1, conserved region 1 n=1 Tax=Desulfovibrio litoralis DSM 11393 TaxID=1121455 RepID=A0A1M7TMN2_9BACT|nr:stealth family protein [Desulfovibrio litoralis]SHN72021.1 Stealth protein CR1, conserved region 1 [Desulfovibrio litoralis DSM 11393]
MEYKTKASFFRRFYSALCDELIELHPATGGCGSCLEKMLTIDERIQKKLEIKFPIDVVYTWVDGGDPLHAEKRNSFLPKQNNIHPNGLENARFRDNEELRYSLRALETFAPWVRKIILVTDAQIPNWLNTLNGKIQIVDHKDFIPHEYLPTFNSHVIEAFLHKIPELAEHYIYLNDDVFLARQTTKASFFSSNGLPFGFVDWRARRLSGYKFTKTPHAQSYFNTLKFFEQKHVETNPKFITAHGPYPATKTNAKATFEFFDKEIISFLNNKFRTTEELAFYSHAMPLWLYSQKKIIPCDEKYYYVQTRRRDRLAYYKAILNSKKDNVAPLFFCINDVGNSKKIAKYQKDLHKVLTAYFPQPSTYEK